MRESLTIFAIAIILVLSALLIGPYFIDWNGQRAWLAAKLSDAVGAKVRIDGPVDVKLLPRPIFRAMRVSIAGATPEDPRFSAERLDAELSINGLLQGGVDFVDARVASPRVEVTMRRDGTIVASPLDIASPQKIQFKHIAIDDGSLAVVDETGADRFVLRGIAAVGEAETLLGPWKLSGSAQGTKGKLAFRLNTGAYAGRKLRTRLVVDGTGDWRHAEADGQITLGPPPRAGGSPAPARFEGSVNLLGSLRIADGAAPVPWAIAATSVTADPQNLAAPAIELRAGADNRAFVATGGALFSLGGTSAGIVKLRARQLDLDHIAVAPEVAPDTRRPNAAQWLAAVRRVLEGAIEPPMRLSVEAAVDAVTSGDLTLTDALASLDARPGTPPHVAFSIAGPEGTRIALDGVVETGTAPAFKGKADIATRNLSAAASWLEPFWPGFADWTGSGAQGQSLALKGAVDLSKVAASARDATLVIGGSTFVGTASVTAGVGDERPRVFADLKADTLDPEQWPDLNRLASLADPFDLAIGLRSDAVRLVRPQSGGSDTGRLSLQLTKQGRAIKLDQFDFAGFGGAAVTGSASLDAERHLRTEARATAKDAGPLAELVRQLIPGAATDALASRASALSPLDVSFRAEAVLDDNSALGPLSLEGSGTAGPTRFAGSVTPELRGGSGRPVEVKLAIDVPEAAQALQQWGWDAEGTFGSLHTDIQARGSLADGFDAKATANTPNAKLSFDGRLALGTGQGRVTASGSDVGPWLRTLHLAMAPTERAWNGAAALSWSEATIGMHMLTARVGGSVVSGELDYARGSSSDNAPAPSLSGTLTIDAASLPGLAGLVLGPPRPTAQGAEALWSMAPFGPAPSWPSTAVALRIGNLGLWPGLMARDAAVKLELRSGVLTLADMMGHVLGGTVGGAVTLRRNGPGVSVTGQIALDRLAFDLPSLAGRLSGSLNLVGSGANPAGLVGSIAGDGTLSIAGATMPRLDPAAIGRVAAAFNAEGESIEDGPVRDALAKNLDRGPLVLGDVQSPATLAAGVLRLTGLKTAVPDATVSSDAAFDLSDLTLSLRTTMTATVLPKEWKGDPPQLTVAWKGPLSAPTRDLDVGAFVNGLAARAIAREQERIELMKDDLRERAFFARRLKQIEAEQQAARDAAQIQKMVPQPPRPGDIRLPKPPDVGVPSVQGVAKPLDEKPADRDALTRFLDALQPKPSPAAGSPAKPIELAPASRPAGRSGSPPATQDPAKEGRY